jgi:protein phosphatase 1G
MGSYLSTPVTEKEVEEGSLNNGTVAYVAVSMQGWRNGQEDAHVCATLGNCAATGDPLSLVGVLDGHGGREVALFCAKHLPEIIKSTEAFKKSDFEGVFREAFFRCDDLMKSESGQKELEVLGDAEDENTQMVKKALKESNVAGALAEYLAKRGKDESQGDDELDSDDNDETAEAPGGADRKKVQAIGNGSSDGDDESADAPGGRRAGKHVSATSTSTKETTKDVGGIADGKDEDGVDSDDGDEDDDNDIKFIVQTATDDDEEEGGQAYRCGATASCVLVVGSNKLVVGNVGDSRTVLCRAGRAIDLSIDHKPNDPRELARIEASGSHVSQEGRVDGNLNLSRALGDLMYKGRDALPPEAQAVTADPDVKLEDLDGSEEFFVIACDGIFDVLSSQQVIDFVVEKRGSGVALQQIAAQMCDRCLAPPMEDDESSDTEGMDNMTLVICVLKPTVAELAAAKNVLGESVVVVEGSEPSHKKQKRSAP